MEQPGREDRLNAWIATERAARARLGASGTPELAQVAALSPQEFFDRIGSGQLPCPPYGELVDFVPIEWSEGRFLFQAPRTAATTIRWVACTAATPRRCWTPAWAARSIPGSRPARAIPPPTCGSATCAR